MARKTTPVRAASRRTAPSPAKQDKHLASDAAPLPGSLLSAVGQTGACVLSDTHVSIGVESETVPEIQQILSYGVEHISPQVRAKAAVISRGSTLTMDFRMLIMRRCRQG